LDVNAHSISHKLQFFFRVYFSPLNSELNPTCHLLALLGAHPILHVSRIRVNGHSKVRALV